MNEEKYFNRIIELTEAKTGWDKAENWTNYNFTLLSDAIKASTGKVISDSTLKRIYGKKKTKSGFYSPHAYTKNILAQYLGFKSWNHFTASQTDLRNDETEQYRKRETDVRGNMILVFSILFFLTGIFLIVRPYILYPQPLKYIECETPVGKIPFTAVFNYELKESHDSVIIDFGNGEKYFLSPDRNMITQFYPGADYSTVIVSLRGRELCRTRVHILSDGWQGGASESDTVESFRPFENQSVMESEGRLFVPVSELEKIGLGLNANSFIEFRNFKDFGMALDETDLEAVVKNSKQDGGKRCYDAEIILRGERGDIITRFMETGCYRYARFVVSEKNYYGRFTDLSFLGRDVSDWSKIRIKTELNRVKVYFNDELVREENYQEELGEFKGIIFRFFGNGSVDRVKMTAGEKILIEDDFD